MRAFYAFMLLICTVQVYGQTISGKILDDEGQAVEFANIILKDANSSEILNVVTTDIDGNYIFTNLSDAAYIIGVSMLGYKEQESEITNFKNSSPITLDFTVYPDAHIMETVEVTSYRPKIIQKGGKTVVTLDNRLQSGASLSSILKKVPGVMVSNRGVRIGASSSIQILINGRSTNYMDMETLLNELPADNIAKIEVVYQPDATYEASGSGPIINVILNGNRQLGTNGSVSSMIGNADGLIHSIGLNLSSFRNNLNIAGGLSHRQSGWTETTEIVRNIGEETYTQYSRNPYRPQSIRANLDLDYYIHPKHTIGIRMNGIQATEKWYGLGNVEIESPTSKNLLSTTTDANEDWNYWRLNPYYEWKWKEEDNDSYLRLDARYVNYTSSDEFAFRRLAESTIPYNNPITIQDGLNKTLSVKLDAQQEFDNRHIVKIGGRYDLANLDNDLQNFVNDEDGTSKPNTGLDNRFLIDEDIYALYTQYEYNSDKWYLSTGLRWETSDTRGTSVTIDSSLTREIEKLFPNASATYQFNPTLGAGLAYSYRIQRPGYYTLNPFRVFYDPLTTDSGNPRLGPEFTHSLQLSLLYEKRPFFRVQYSDTKDALFQGIIQNDLTGESTRQMINIDSRRSLSSRLFFPLDFIPGITGVGGVMVNYVENTSTLPDFNYQNSKWSVIWYHQIEAKLPADIKLETTTWVGSGGLEGMIEADWFAGGYIELSKTFLEKKLMLSLELEDFITRGTVGNIQYQNIDASLNNYPNFYSVYFRAKYKFGNKYFKEKTKRDRQSDGLERLQK